MRNVWISALLFIVLICLCAVNFVYVHGVAHELAALTEKLPALAAAEAVPQAEQLCGYWEAQRELLSLTVGQTVLDAIGEQLALLRSALVCGDAAGYVRARTLLLRYAENLPRLERFRTDNIF